MPDFCLSKRYDSPFWYVSFKNPYTQVYGTKKSTGTTNKVEATKIAYQMLFEEKKTAFTHILEALKQTDLTPSQAADIVGVLDSKHLITTIITKEDAGAESFSGFLTRFWNYDESPYVKEKLHKNHSIHLKYVKSNSSCVDLYWKPYFKDTPIAKLTKNDLNQFMESLDAALSGARKNNIVKVGTIALKWAFNNHLIPKDITSGLRSGEIIALRKRDIGEDCLYVQHSWNHVDKQKTTKNNENRTAYVLFPEILEGLKRLADSNPYNEGLDGYVFWASIPGKPRENPAWIADLRTVAKEIGFTTTEQISFHGWRHFFTTYMYNELDEKVHQKATGHKTVEMLRHYANHDRDADAAAIQDAIKKVFKPIMYAG